MSTRRTAAPAILETTIEMLSRVGDSTRSYRSVFEDPAGHASRFVAGPDVKTAAEAEEDEIREGSGDSVAPEKPVYGVNPATLYEFAQGEILQWERLFRLGFRYAESMLDMSQQRYREATAPDAPAEVVAVKSGNAARTVPFKIINRTNGSVRLTFLLSEIIGMPSNTVVPVAAQFDCAKRDLVADEEVTVTLTLTFPPGDADLTYTGEIVVRGGSLELKHRLKVTALQQPMTQDEVPAGGAERRHDADEQRTPKQRSSEQRSPERRSRDTQSE